MSRRRPLLAAAAVAAALAAPATAYADILAAYERPVSDANGVHFDLRIHDVSTGRQLPLPPGATTAHDELHPSLSGDGRLLVFERARRGEVYANLTTSPTNNVFSLNAFTLGAAERSIHLFNRRTNVNVTPDELRRTTPGRTTPAISPDGTRVATANYVSALDTARSGVTVFNTENGRSFQVSAGGTGPTGNPSIGNGAGGLVAFARPGGFPNSSPNSLQIAAARRSAPARLAYETRSSASFPRAYDHPALHPTDAFMTAAEQIALDTSTVLGGAVFPAYRTADIKRVLIDGRVFSFFGTMNAAINTSADERMASWSAEGRFLGFVRFVDRPGSSIDQARLLVFDTATQQLLNPEGVFLYNNDPGTPRGFYHRNRGSLSLVRDPTITCEPGPCLSAQRNLAAITAQVADPTAVGILVQRVVGRQRVPGGGVVPRLRTAGRVPLGKARPGRFRARWNLRVAGRRLAPGRYQVTVRAVAGRRIRDLAEPEILVIGRRGKITARRAR